MQKICKSVLVFWGLILSTVFWACDFGPEDHDFSLLPDNGLRYRLFPNDMANNDSASASLAHGISFLVHPKASYELSFDIDSSIAKAPTLQLFKTFPVKGNAGYVSLVKLKNVSAKSIDGRYVYRFSCESASQALWAVTLEQNRTFYNGSTNKVRLTGDGAYSDTLSLNLIVVGNVASSLNFTIDELASDMLEQFRRYYTSVTIDTLYVNYANEHPSLGKKYPADKPWYAGWSSDDMMVSELGGWPGVENALDIVLVNYINEDGILGYSNLFSGNMGGGEGSTVVIGAYAKNLSRNDPQSKRNIVETAIHETGHFFGLRHTTSTQADVDAGGDKSNYEDGFEDTPVCSQITRYSSLLKKTDSKTMGWLMPKIRVSALSYVYEKCPDASNLMFPVETAVEYDGLSEQQLATLRATLMIYPH